MFCKHCGSQLKDDSKFCHNCGVSTGYRTQQPQQYLYQAQPAQQSATGENTLAILGFAFAFFIPLAGLVCSILGYNKSKKGAPYGGLALAGIIISTIVIVLCIIAIIIIFSVYFNLIFYYHIRYYS